MDHAEQSPMGGKVGQIQQITAHCTRGGTPSHKSFVRLAYSPRLRHPAQVGDGTLLFGTTPHGVLVQLYFGRTSNGDCRALFDTSSNSAGSLNRVIAIVREEPGLSAAQRQELARVLSKQPNPILFALMTDSALIRGSLTALNWITGRGRETRLFKMSEIETAMDFLRMPDAERPEVRTLVQRLGQKHIDGHVEGLLSPV